MKSSRLDLVNCHLCGKDDYKVIYPSTLLEDDFSHDKITSEMKNTLGDYKKHSRIVKCFHCNLIYTNPMENPNSLMEGYEDVIDEEYLKTEKFRKILHTEHLKQIEKFKKKGNLLDIGCFAGYFLELAKERGWNTFGIEPSKWASNMARSRNIKIIGNDIQKIRIKNAYYDVITMWDVIEHLSNPIDVLDKCYKSLKDNGIIALGTPDYECLIARIMGNNYPYLVRMHHVLYTPETLSNMLEKSGFKVIKKYTYGRTFPVSYILDRLKINVHVFKKFKNYVKSISSIADYKIHLNFGDSFVLIGRKALE